MKSKFFKKDHSKLYGDIARDDRNFLFQEGKEISTTIEDEKDITLYKKGITFNELPTPYQYFPYYHKNDYEDIIFEVETIGHWTRFKPYSRSIIYAESIKILRKLTKQQFEEEIYNNYKR